MHCVDLIGAGVAASPEERSLVTLTLLAITTVSLKAKLDVLDAFGVIVFGVGRLETADSLSL